MSGAGKQADARVLGRVLGLDGWVWEHPELPGLRIADICPFAADDCWAVGARGLVAHFDGATWSGGLPWLDDEPRAVWGARPGDVWFAGRRLVRYHDGCWSVDPNGPPPGKTVLGLSGTGAEDVWAVGIGFCLHFDGVAWRKVADRGGQAVWARAPDDVWVAWATFCKYDGDLHWIGGHPGGGLRRFDGRAWQEWDFGRPVLAVAGSGSTDVWAAGPYGLVRRFDGVGWHDDRPAEKHDWAGLHVGRPGDVWLVGAVREDRRKPVPLVFRRRAGAWEPLEHSEHTPANRLVAVRATASDDLWLAGWSEVYRPVGHGLEPVGRRCQPAYDSLLTIAGSGPCDLWAAGPARVILHRDRKGWSQQPTGWPGVIFDLAARGPDEAWAVGSHGLVGRYDGRAWRRLEPPVDCWFSRVATDGAGAAWIAGEQLLLRHDGRGFSVHELPARRASPIALAVDASGQAWAAVELWPKGGRLYRLCPGGPVPQGPDLPVPPMALWARGLGEVWFFHQRGVLIGDGQRWEEGPPGLVQVHQAVGDRSDDLWLMGHDRLLQWTGGSLVARTWPHLQLKRLWRGPDCVYAAGENGAILRLDA